MNVQKLSYALENINSKFIEEAETIVSKRSSTKVKGHVLRWSAVAACIALVAVVGIGSMLRGEELPLSELSQNVSVRVQSPLMQTATTSEYCLIALTEEELFTEFDTVIFQGTVSEIQNIELNFNGMKEYRALVQIEIGEVYRGALHPGDTVTLLADSPINGQIYTSTSGTVSQMKEGMRGIFMPHLYDTSSILGMNGATLALTDIADGGFPDGIRYAFLEDSDNGELIFSRTAYPSIAEADTLYEVEAYVKDMIEKTDIVS